MTLPDAAESPVVPRGDLPAAVLWDMDGTLVDTEPYWFAAERDLVERFGNGHWPDEMAKQVVGFDLLDSAAFLQDHAAVDLPAREIVDRLLDGVIARLQREIPWRPGARELLADLRAAGLPCALVTMSWRRFVDPVLAALPDGSFVATVTGDEVPEGEGKPEPTPYLIGADACGFHPADCLAIEDSPTGVRSALGAGCRVLGVPNVRSLEPGDGLTVVDTLEDVRLDDLAELFRADHPDLAPPGVRSHPIADVRTIGNISIDRRALVGGALVAALIAAIAVAATRGGEEAPPPLPPGAVAIDVWAPYWTLTETVGEAEARFGQVREISPFWYAAEGAERIVVDRNAPEALSGAFLDAANESFGSVVPSIVDAMPAGGMAAVLADPSTRRAHIETILQFAADNDVDGIDLDYEQFAFADGRDTWDTTRPNWVAFVVELAAELHARDLTLTVSIPGVWAVADVDGSPVAGAGYTVYDHGTIAAHVDRIRIMAYDFSVAQPGPIAPLAWVQDVVDGTSAIVPEEWHDKLVLGVPSYGSNWVRSTVGDCPTSAEGRTNVTARTALGLAERRGGVPAYDPVTSEWSFSYPLTVDDGTLTCVQNREVHWVDAEGIADRVEIARRAGWGGVALWALGYEDAEAWNALVTSSRQPLAP